MALTRTRTRTRTRTLTRTLTLTLTLTRTLTLTLTQVQQRLIHIMNYSVRGMLVHNTLTELAEDLRLAAAAEEI